MGRLTRDPEVRYTQSAEPLAVARFGIAVNKRFKRDNEPDADFFNCTAFGKTGEFASRYFKKGMMVSIVGRLSNNNWVDNNGNKRTSTDIIVEEQFFAESKASFEAHRASAGYSAAPMPSEPAPMPTPAAPQTDDFYNVDSSIDDDNLPF